MRVEDFSAGSTGFKQGEVHFAPFSTARKADFAGPTNIWHGAAISESSIGRYFALGEHSSVVRSSIGNYCTFGSRVAVNPFSHPVGWLSMHEFQYSPWAFDNVEYQSCKRVERDKPRRCEIGADVWIGHNAVVLCREVGTGAAIGAGAIVTKDVPPYAIVAGNPAAVLRYRFDEDTIHRLIESKWWERSLEELSGLPFNDVREALKAL